VTVNRQEAHPNQPSLGGMDRGTDIRDLPWGIFRLCRNVETLSREGKAITRNGFVALSDRIYDEPFVIIGGAGGGRTVVPPIYIPPPPSSDMSLKLVAVPNTGLFANAENPQTVTFIVYPSLDSGVTIASYSWDFSYDGVTRSADSTGSATTQDNEYTAAGTYKIQVWGTGTDSKEYNATVQITITAFGSTAPQPEDLPEPPVEEEDKDIDEKLPPTIELTANPATITSGDTAKLTYIAARADTLTFYKSTDDTFEQTLTVSGNTIDQGTIEVTPTETTVYRIIARNAYGFPTGTVAVTVGTPDAAVPGYLIISPVLTKTTVDGEIYYNVSELTNFTVYVYCIEKDTTTVIAFPDDYDPLLSITDLNPLGTTLNVISPTFNVGRTLATFALQQLDLAETVESGLVKLKASLPNITPSVNADSVNVWVIAPSATLTTTCVDVDGTDSTQVETDLYGTPDAGGFMNQMIYLKISASVATFDSDVQLTWDYDSGEPIDTEKITVKFTNATGFDAYSDATTSTLIDAGLVPGELFLEGDAGYVSVAVSVKFPATQGYTTAQNLTLSFDATEIVNE